MCSFNPYPLEINSNDGLKQEHLEFFSSATKTSPLPQCLWPPNLARWAATHKVTSPSDHVIFATSCDKLKPLCLHHHSTYGHKTWWDCDLSLRAPNHKVKQHPDHLVLQSHVANKNHCISIPECLWPLKLKGY